jgi:hypothetical protein
MFLNNDFDGLVWIVFMRFGDPIPFGAYTSFMNEFWGITVSMCLSIVLCGEFMVLW